MCNLANVAALQRRRDISNCEAWRASRSGSVPLAAGACENGALVAVRHARACGSSAVVATGAGQCNGCMRHELEEAVDAVLAD